MVWTTLTNLATGDLVTEAHMDAIRENINYLLNPTFQRVVYTRGSDYTTTSTSFANVDTTNITLSITTNGGLLLCGFMCLAGSSSATVPVQFDIAFNSTRITGNTNGMISSFGSSSPTTGIYLYEPAAGTYTVTLQWRMQAAGTATLDGEFPVYLWVTEF